MTPRKPNRRLLQLVTPGRSLIVNQSSRLPLNRPLALSLALVATLLLITLINAPLASAQHISPTNKATSPPVSPANETPQSARNRSSRPVPKDAPKESEPQPAAVPTPVAASPSLTPAVSSQSADDRLPFMASDARDNHEQPPSAAGLLVRTLGALLLIVGLIVAVAWGMKRFGGARFGTPQENAPSLAVLNSLSLGERRSLTIVRFGDRTLLLGSTAHTVTLLAEADTDDFTPQARSVAEILSEEKPADFSQQLLSATEHLDQRMETRRGHHFTA